MKHSSIRWVLPIILFLAACVNACTSNTGGDEGVGSVPEHLLDKGWTLVALAGDVPDPESRVTLRFEADGSLGGFDGCNRYRGTYSAQGASLNISQELAMTMMACTEPLTSSASAYAGALERTASFLVEGKRLSLRDSALKEVAGFEADDPGLAGTSWKVLSYNNGKQAVVSLIGDTRITADFSQDGRVSGSAGCNRYFSTYEIAGESINIGRAGTTRKLCRAPEGVMDQEMAYLRALNSAATYRREGEKLTLRKADGALAVSMVQDPGTSPRSVSPVSNKIRFDPAKLNEEGLQGPRDGLRALHYEYCLPDRPDVMREVSAIDPTLEVQRGSRGRIGCGAGELLCMGHTHQSGHLAVLERLASHREVVEIRESFFE